MEDLTGDAALLYHFGFGCFVELFPPDDYASKMAVVPSINQMRQYCANKDVVIVVGGATPTQGSQAVGQSTFDLHVICILRSKEEGKNAQDYDAIRFMRHPGYECYWEQEKNDAIVTKCSSGEDIYRRLADMHSPGDFFFQCVSVYVRRGSDTTMRMMILWMRAWVITTMIWRQ